MRRITENWTTEFRNMQVDEQVSCPPEKYGVINTLIRRIMVEGMNDDVAYSLRIDKENKQLIVKRMS